MGPRTVIIWLSVAVFEGEQDPKIINIRMVQMNDFIISFLFQKIDNLNLNL